MQSPPNVARLTALVLMAALSSGNGAHAAHPMAPAGDLSLRQDVQLLADAGVLRMPVTTWPMAWAPVLADLARIEDSAGWSTAVTLAAARVRKHAESAAGVRGLRYQAGISVADRPMPWRSFADTPRETAEVSGGLSWIGDTINLELNGQAVSSPDDGEEFRVDDSHVAVSVGNYSIAASTLNRWWGPGWDGSLILSSNARPIPSLAVDRIVTEPFRSRWLSWLGPWRVSALFGRMESDRAVPEARFFGFRFNFRPLPSLEVGLSRTAQWCGEGRPCDLDTFVDLLLGRDNRGDEGIGTDNEPGNQLAGIDFRWSPGLLGRPLALYGQFIGEDEAGGFPSKFLGQAGMETSGSWRDQGSWRGFLEMASTKCGFYQPEEDYNCAYNHGIYQTGYRYRGRAVGHGSDNDSLTVSTGLLLVDPDDSLWSLVARYGELNRGGAPDPRHTLTTTREDLVSLDLMHARSFRYGVIELGAGIERLGSASDGRAFLRWRTAR